MTRVQYARRYGVKIGFQGLKDKKIKRKTNQSDDSLSIMFREANDVTNIEEEQKSSSMINTYVSVKPNVML